MIKKTEPREVHTLRHIRANVLKLTQEVLADMLGVSVRTYARYESSDAMPPTARKLLDTIVWNLAGKAAIQPAKERDQPP